MHLHFLHMVWAFGHYVGYFHEQAVLVTWIMVIFGLVAIYVFYKIFERDLFGDSSNQ